MKEMEKSRTDEEVSLVKQLMKKKKMELQAKRRNQEKGENKQG
jgi:hypothetical protein